LKVFAVTDFIHVVDESKHQSRRVIMAQKTLFNVVGGKK
jgi:hypothetical protein